jgi:hypothetical protein
VPIILIIIIIIIMKIKQNMLDCHQSLLIDNTYFIPILENIKIYMKTT